MRRARTDCERIHRVAGPVISTVRAGPYFPRRSAVTEISSGSATGPGSGPAVINLSQRVFWDDPQSDPLRVRFRVSAGD